MSDPASDAASGRSLGPVLLLVGLLGLYFAGGIAASSLGDNQDPGPRAFPMVLSGLLALGGLVETVRGVVVQRGAKRSGAVWGVGTSWSRLRDRLGEPGNRDAMLLVLALVIYVPAIGRIGFGLSTLVFAALIMVRLGARWWSALTVSLGLVVVVHLLFVTLFRVQLPVGVLGLPW